MPPFEVAQPYPNSWYGRFGIDELLVDRHGRRRSRHRHGCDRGGREESQGRDREDDEEQADQMDRHDAPPLRLERRLQDLPSDGRHDLRERPRHGRPRGLVRAGEDEGAHVIGVSDRIALAAGKQVFEIGVPAGNAHTAYDLYVFDASTRTVFAGDLVTTSRCPMLSDPDSDLKGWIAILERFEGLGARGLVPTRGNPVGNATPEIEKTRLYLTSMLAFLVEKKKQNAPEARVSGELAAEKLADYCPRELNAINALSVYRRLLPDGTTRPGTAAAKPAAK